MATTTLPTAAPSAPAGRRARTDRAALARRVGWRLVAIGVLLAVWAVLAAAGVWSEVIVPSPAQVWRAFVQSITIHDGQRGLSDHYLWEHLWASFWRIANGVGWAIVIGAPLGLALASSRWFQVIVEPYVNFLRSLPPLAYFSLLIIWFGIDNTSKIWLLFLAAFPPITLAVLNSAQHVRADRVNAARSLGASRPQLLVHTVLPSVLPDLLTGIRVAVGFAWTTIVAAETSNGLPGIGGLAWATKKELRTDVAIMCVIVIGATAIVLDQLIKAVERAVVPWKGKA